MIPKNSDGLYYLVDQLCTCICTNVGGMSELLLSTCMKDLFISAI